MRHQSKTSMRAVVVGIGNELLGDDGVGIHVIGELEKRGVPSATTLIEAGTAVDMLWDEIVGAGKVIVVDAVKGGGPPGSVYRYLYGECPEGHGVTQSGHEVGLRDKLVALELMGCTLPQVVVIGIEPERVEFGAGLSSCLRNRLPAVVDIVLEEIGMSPAEATVPALGNTQLSGR